MALSVSQYTTTPYTGTSQSVTINSDVKALVLLLMCSSSATAPSSITVGGQPMTLERTDQMTNYVISQIWSLWLPPTGSQTITLTGYAGSVKYWGIIGVAEGYAPAVAKNGNAADTTNLTYNVTGCGTSSTLKCSIIGTYASRTLDGMGSSTLMWSNSYSRATFTINTNDTYSVSYTISPSTNRAASSGAAFKEYSGGKQFSIIGCVGI